MSQEDIIKFLKNKKIPLSVDEISKHMDTNKSRVFVLIKILVQHKEIKFMEINREVALKLYNSKRRMKLYYV